MAKHVLSHDVQQPQVRALMCHLAPVWHRESAPAPPRASLAPPSRLPLLPSPMLCNDLTGLTVSRWRPQALWRL